MQPEVISGEVVPFKGNGRKLGYPTANIRTDTELQDGVYFGFADLADFKNSPALIFIGTPTTLGDTERRVEVHLLDIPDEDYYGEHLSVRTEHFHRHNQTFANINDLVEIMREDDKAARHWFQID